MTIDRRSFLTNASFALAGAYGVLATSPVASAAGEASIVETRAGKIRGEAVSGVHTFRGIPYGADCGGKRRFLPPIKPQPWTGVREALQFGHTAPQGVDSNPSEYTLATRWNELPPQGEDCLVLNVWTPGIDSRKRPVMFSIHGGGFASGTGSNPVFDGDPLARFGDVVVVTINHRLNRLGYLHLGDLDPAFTGSGLAGLLDIVLALEWVRDNIASFGGDPGKVTVMGQSGGGMKICNLMAMPAAKGLFHRAIVQSGPALRSQDREAAARNTERLLSGLGIEKANFRALQDLPLDKLQAAGGGSGPVVDGAVLPRHPFEPDASDVSAAVPLLIGTNLHDMAFTQRDPNLDEAGLKTSLDRTFAGSGDRILKSYRAAEPNATPFQLMGRISTDRGWRLNSMQIAERKAALNQAPAFMYVLTFPAAAKGGRWGAVHGTEVPLSFHNVNAWPLTGNGPEAKAMADIVAGAWVAFAKAGNPSTKSSPAWPAYQPNTRATMMLNLQCKVENHPFAELLDLFKGTGGGRAG